MIEAMRDAARNGSGFIAYQYESPPDGKNESDLAYIKRVDDTWWLGSDIYGPGVVIPPLSPEVVRTSLKARVDYAAQYARTAGKELALAEFHNVNGSFAANGMYIFAFDMNGTTLGMPFQKEKIWKNESNLTDINGFCIGKEKLRLSRQGGGFFYYVYTNPDSGRPELKVSYVEPVDSGWVAGAGEYLPGVPAVFALERRNQLVSRVGEAVDYVLANGRETAIREFNNPKGTFSGKDMFIFAFDGNGTLLANPYLPGITDMNRLKDRDPYGNTRSPP